MKTIGLIIIIASGAALIFLEVKKRTTFARLEHYMGEQDLDAYLALLDKPLTKVLYPEYNLLFMRLNAYLALGDNDKTARLIEQMLPLRMSKEQDLALAIRAFSFYVEVEDKKAARDMLKRIETNGPEALAKASRETYDIFLCGSSAYVDEMERALKEPRRPRSSACARCWRCSTRTAGTRREPRSTGPARRKCSRTPSSRASRA